MKIALLFVVALTTACGSTDTLRVRRYAAPVANQIHPQPSQYLLREGTRCWRLWWHEYAEAWITADLPCPKLEDLY